METNTVNTQNLKTVTDGNNSATVDTKSEIKEGDTAFSEDIGFYLVGADDVEYANENHWKVISDMEKDTGLLTIEKLDKIPRGEIFSTGITTNDPDGIYMTDYNFGKSLLWIAKKGNGYNDWAIYIHWAEKGIEFVKTQGDKVTNKENIQKLVPCDNEVFSKYRY